MDYQSCGLRELKFAEGDGVMTFAGYGAVFGNVDFGGDMITPGAFSASLAAHKTAGSMPQMFYEHGKYGGGPAMPVGVWTSLSEDGHGLRGEGRLLDTQMGRDLHVALKAGAVTGLSIGYRVTDSSPRVAPTDPKRTIKAAHLGEVSLVNDPMNPRARIVQVKSADEIKTIREFEDWLRDAGGFSSVEAKRLAAGGYKAFAAGRDDGDESVSELAVALKRNIAALTI